MAIARPFPCSGAPPLERHLTTNSYLQIREFETLRMIVIVHWMDFRWTYEGMLKPVLKRPLAKLAEFSQPVRVFKPSRCQDLVSRVVVIPAFQLLSSCPPYNIVVNNLSLCFINLLAGSVHANSPRFSCRLLQLSSSSQIQIRHFWVSEHLLSLPHLPSQ